MAATGGSIRRLILSCALLEVLLLLPSTAEAMPEYLQHWINRYPESTLPERLERQTGSSCSLCHVNSEYAWNAPGNAYRELIHALRHLRARDVPEAIEIADGMDADGDGFPSGREILAPRPDGVGYHPGLVGERGIDPTGATGGEVITGVPETPPGLLPIAFEPPVLDFGDVPAGWTIRLPLVVRNAGTDPCTLARIILDPGAMTGYSIPSQPPFPVSLNPGADIGITIRFDAIPQSYFYRSIGWFRIDADCAPEGRAATLIRGRGVRSSVVPISLSPSLLDFGVAAAGGESTLSLSLTNDGAFPVRVLDASLQGSQAAWFHANRDYLSGLSLAPGAAAAVDIRFSPPAEGRAAARLELRTDHPWVPGLSTAIRGEGRWAVSPGDANGDGSLDIADAVAILLDLFLSSDSACPEALDANDDGLADISDAILLLAHLFLGGPGPEDCALDDSPRYLGCAGPTPCQ